MHHDKPLTSPVSTPLSVLFPTLARLLLASLLLYFSSIFMTTGCSMLSVKPGLGTRSPLEVGLDFFQHFTCGSSWRAKPALFAPCAQDQADTALVSFYWVTVLCFRETSHVWLSEDERRFIFIFSEGKEKIKEINPGIATVLYRKHYFWAKWLFFSWREI